MQLSAFCGVSVDGFLARPDDALDFLAAGEPAEIQRQLAARGFRHAYVDGGITIQRFLAAGWLDRMVITRVPVLIGAGVPLFGPLPGDIQLRHVATRSLPAGLVQSEYRIAAR